MTTTYTGDVVRASLDSLLVQPEIEHLVLAATAGPGTSAELVGGTPLPNARVRGSSRLTAYSYDQKGLLAEATAGAGNFGCRPMQPGGFTYVLFSLENCVRPWPIFLKRAPYAWRDRDQWKRPSPMKDGVEGVRGNRSLAKIVMCTIDVPGPDRVPWWPAAKHDYYRAFRDSVSVPPNPAH